MLASEETVSRLVKISDLLSDQPLLDDFMAEFAEKVRGQPADSARLWTASALDHVQRVVRLHDFLFGYPSPPECEALLKSLVFKSRRTAQADETLEKYFGTLNTRRMAHE